MRYVYGLSMIALVFLAGCKDEEPPAPEVQPPPPKTVNEIYSDYKAALQPLLAGATTPGTITTQEMKNPIISQFQTKKREYAQEINEPEAVGRIESDITDAISKARDAEEWYALDGLLDVHKSLNPNSQRYQTVRRRADLMLARPWIMVTGFAEIDAGDLVVFVTVMDPKTREKEDLRVREGEEFYTDAEGKSVLRLIRVVGAQSAIEVEYLRLPGETWEVPGPKNR